MGTFDILKSGLRMGRPLKRGGLLGISTASIEVSKPAGNAIDPSIEGAEYYRQVHKKVEAHWAGTQKWEPSKPQSYSEYLRTRLR